MKQPKDGGRLLADVGEERKRKLYKRLFDLRLSFKEWLKNFDGMNLIIRNFFIA